jgi:hypothetical protein
MVIQLIEKSLLMEPQDSSEFITNIVSCVLLFSHLYRQKFYIAYPGKEFRSPVYSQDTWIKFPAVLAFLMFMLILSILQGKNLEIVLQQLTSIFRQYPPEVSQLVCSFQYSLIYISGWQMQDVAARRFSRGEVRYPSVAK